MATDIRNQDTKLWPQLVDHLARERPNTAYGLWPVASDSYDEGFHTITYGQLSNIVNGLAWWIVKQLGPGNDAQQEVLTYIGPNDVRLTAMILASVKAGFVLFLTSPRNSPAAQRSLFEALKCRTLITSDSRLPSVLPIIDVVAPRCLTIPSVDELLKESFPPFAYDKAFEAGRWDPLFVLHTSGSTGMPKPLVWTQESVARHYTCAIQEVERQQDATSVEHLMAGKRVVVTVPSFHGAGILQYMVWAICAGCIPIAPAAVGIVTAHGLADALKHTPAEIAILVPSVIADLAQNPDQLAYCASHLSLILYIGGDLPQAIGDIVAAQIPLRCWWGASEVGIPHQLIPRGLGPNDWRYIQFHPSVGAAFDPVSDGVYELVVRQDKALPQTSFSIRGQEHLAEYRTKDLFHPHPTVANAWCWRARADDIIVFLNGEKTNPVSMEQHIVARNPELSGALVIGTQRFQAALLIDPVALNERGPLNTSEQAALIERVWPSVQEANAVAPAHARVEKSLILVVDRPLIRAGKGTIQRASSIQQYTSQIETLYTNADLVLDDENSPDEASSNLTNIENVTRFVRESVCAVTDWPHSDEAYTTGTFFEHGMDSLMALRLIRLLRRGLHRPDLGLSTIYSNPTVTQLSTALLAEKDEHKDGDALLMKPLLSTYRALIEQIPKPDNVHAAGKPRGVPVTAVLTGSTGTVGTFLLRALLDRPGIDRVYCLNRSEDGGYAAQKLRMTERGLNVADLDERVTFLPAALDQPFLGVGEKAYKELCDHVGIIIHNAWPVNFNLRLSAFQPQLAGLVNLFRLSTTTSTGHPASLIFISSVSAVGTGGSASDKRPIPEQVPTLSDAPDTNGYARSKFLSEMLCDSAAQQLGIPVTIARVGQVAGAVRLPGGEWNQKEWFPSLVIGSLSMGCLPDNLGTQFNEIDWLPADLLADVLVDLVQDQLNPQSGTSDSASVYNLRNPHTTTWEKLLPSIIEKARTLLGPDRMPIVVPPSTWLEKLDAASKETGDEAVTNPAIKLVEFYRDYLWGTGEQEKTPPMSVEKAYAHSTALRELQAIKSQWVQKWVSEWLS
ncbi:Linear gramicidin synthase subunit D [Cytospora mali]|uniref:Non-canonical non-ribosomal peptide synthetase SDG1 n=1 Tax=Cytospora mali TaxID=578113 RepID=SDG1_CYTMA|nr:Linear gramicidin synthase subunit D [Valsa mali]